MAVTWDGSAWVASTAYPVNARAVNAGNAYRCITAGTSASSGGPTTTAADITDGSVHWAYLGPYAAAVTDCGPNLVDIPAPTQATILAEVEREVQADAWGDRVDDGQRFLAAHLAILYKNRGRGAVTEQHTGQVGRSYADLSRLGILASTMYGAEYQRLLRMLPDALFPCL